MDDHDLALRRAIVARLKADPAVAAIVGVRVYEEVVPNPTWPFIRYGLPIVEPIKVDGWHMASHALTIHAFAEGPGTDQVSALRRAIYNALDEAEVEIEGQGVVCSIAYSGHNTGRDTAEASNYHAAIEFEAATAEAA